MNEEILAVADLNILVVDDKSFIRSMMRRHLNGLGVSNVRDVADGRKALDILRGNGPLVDVVFCDLQMPDIGGIELVRYVAELPYVPAFVFVSGSHETLLALVADLARSRGINVLDAVVKPISRDMIGQILEEFCSTQAAIANEKKLGAVFSPTRAEFETAITAEEFYLQYQPKLSLRSGKFEGLEILMRWRHPIHGLIWPTAFIDAAEKTGAIRPLTDWVAATAFAQCSAWNAQGLNLKFSINLSAAALKDDDLPDRLAEAASRAGIDPQQVVFEIAEIEIFRDNGAIVDALTRLNQKGFALSIDSFGAGRTTIEQLRRVPLSEMKIERVLIQYCVVDAQAREILESSVKVAQEMGIEVVAKGAETAEEIELVKNIGVDMVQSFFIAMPMLAADAFDWIKAHRHAN